MNQVATYDGKNILYQNWNNQINIEEMDNISLLNYSNNNILWYMKG